MDYQFPLFRKYNNNQSYFKIISQEEVVELKRMPGSIWEEIKVPSSNYFDKVHIQELIEANSSFVEKISEEDYLKIQNIT